MATVIDKNIDSNNSNISNDSVKDGDGDRDGECDGGKHKIKTYTSFDDMGLKNEILRGIYEYGFEKPSVIQQRGIVALYSGRDIIAQSQSGTGKTATFVIGLLQQIDESLNETQGLILAPTRELAKQINVVVKNLSSNMMISTSLYIGGNVNFNRFDNNNNVPHVIIGTPGRILDMLRRNKIDIGYLKLFVLDEADEMLSRGFLSQIHNIFQFIPNSAQVGLFSATMPDEMLDITTKFMKDPVRLLVKNNELTLEGIRQFYVVLDKEEYKFDALCDLYNTISITQCMIYCNTRKKVNFLTEKLKECGFAVSCILGDMYQKERDEVMENFRKGDVRVLITTDILARGIDVQQVSLVINYDLPFNKETYIHRIGRSGRFGRKGVAINFVTQYDYKKVQEIEQFYNTQVDELPSNISELL